MSWFTSLFPFVPPHVLALAGVLVVILVLARWGDLIFAGYAFWTFWNGQQVDAVCYLVIAVVIGGAKAWAMLFMRAAGFGGPRV